METHIKHQSSIWGKYWESLRIWFYPAWLMYETTHRFYTYSLDMYCYVSGISSQQIALISSVLTIIICTLFLTLPTCFILYKFLKVDNLTKSNFGEKLKRFL